LPILPAALLSFLVELFLADGVPVIGTVLVLLILPVLLLSVPLEAEFELLLHAERNIVPAVDNTIKLLTGNFIIKDFVSNKLLNEIVVPISNG